MKTIYYNVMPQLDYFGTDEKEFSGYYYITLYEVVDGKIEVLLPSVTEEYPTVDEDLVAEWLDTDEDFELVAL